MKFVSGALMESGAQGFTPRRGKVRDVYDLGDKLLIVATDRISALDWVFPNGVPGKGRILTHISRLWLEPGHMARASLGNLVVPNHFMSVDPKDFPEQFRGSQFAGRSMLCLKADRVIPFECIARGYLAGSGWKDYQETGCVCGIALPPGLWEGDKLPEPIFTPSTKAKSGHDANVPFAQMEKEIGTNLARTLRARSLDIYEAAYEYALGRGIIIADTKLEWGITSRIFASANPILIDEVLTPDSSRFWLLETHKPGGPQPSLDKQPVRDWLNSLSEEEWDRKSPPPALPKEQVDATRLRYLKIFRLLNNGNGLQ